MKTKRIKAILFGSHVLGWRWELPADAESYERMVEQAAAALAKGFVHAGVYNDADRQYQNNMRRYYRTRARTALRAIGIRQPKKQKGTK